jgi:GntR family transcriptional regulator / MocR family aminotransferase
MRPATEQRGVRELLLEVELRPRHMREALRDSLRRAIQDGRLPARTVLPSSRRLAADLGVSRGVVTDAYEQLAAEGYLAVWERLAPVVADVVATAPPSPDPPAARWRFNTGAVTPDVGLFPRPEWRRAMERALRTAPDAALDYADHRGQIELRTALSD